MKMDDWESEEIVAYIQRLSGKCENYFKIKSKVRKMKKKRLGILERLFGWAHLVGLLAQYRLFIWVFKF